MDVIRLLIPHIPGYIILCICIILTSFATSKVRELDFNIYKVSKVEKFGDCLLASIEWLLFTFGLVVIYFCLTTIENVLDVYTIIVTLIYIFTNVALFIETIRYTSDTKEQFKITTWIGLLSWLTYPIFVSIM